MNEWISVKDRLPDEDGEVLIYMPNEDWEELIAIVPFSVEHKKFYSYSDEVAIDQELKRITHWMPLPEPPKEVQL